MITQESTVLRDHLVTETETSWFWFAIVRLQIRNVPDRLRKVRAQTKAESIYSLARSTLLHFSLPVSVPDLPTFVQQNSAMTRPWALARVSGAAGSQNSHNPFSSGEQGRSPITKLDTIRARLQYSIEQELSPTAMSEATKDDSDSFPRPVASVEQKHSLTATSEVPRDDSDGSLQPVTPVEQRRSLTATSEATDKDFRSSSRRVAPLITTSPDVGSEENPILVDDSPMSPLIPFSNRPPCREFDALVGKPPPLSESPFKSATREFVSLPQPQRLRHSRSCQPTASNRANLKRKRVDPEYDHNKRQRTTFRDAVAHSTLRLPDDLRRPIDPISPSSASATTIEDSSEEYRKATTEALQWARNKRHHMG